MIRLLGLLAAFALAGFAAAWVAEEPGGVTLAWRDWEVRASLGVFLLALGLVVALAAGLGALGRAAAAAPGRFRRWRAERRRRKGWRALETGLAAAAGGDARKVRRALRGARLLPEDAPLRLLLQAEAAALEGDAKKRRAALDSMARHGTTELAALRGLVDELRGQGAHGEAMGLVGRALERRPAPEWALRECLGLALRLQLWDRAASALSEMRGRGLLPKAEADRKLALVAVERARVLRGEGHSAKAARAAGEAVSALPGFAPAAMVAGGIHLAAGEARSAARVASAAWAGDPHPELAEIVLRAEGGGDAMEEMKALERLAASNPDASESHLALARAALKAELWGLARKHLRGAMAGAADARAFRLRAALERSEHSDREAEARWLDRALDAPPAPSWICGGCGKERGEWSAVCTECGAFDRMEWRSAPKSGAGEGAEGGRGERPKPGAAEAPGGAAAAA